ncbi:MAG: alanine dehydrogenase [Bacteroidales bacterium]|nr:alanine dehydrogenase [Bacteroidales bacterium]
MTPTNKPESRYSFPNGGLLPREETLEVAKKPKNLSIGLPMDDQNQESRVCLTPEAVEILVNHGHEVRIENNAGKASNYSNTDYSEKGAQIMDKKEEIFASDILLKIAPPSLQELKLLKPHQILFSSLHLNSQNKEFMQELITRKVTAIAFEKIKDENNSYPVTSSMSAIAGNTAVLIAAEYLSNLRGGKGVMLGGITGITPTEVVILGAGTAAEYAVRAAMGLGAFVKVFDQSVPRLRRLQNNVGIRLHTSVFHPRVIKNALKSADVLIGAIHMIEKGPRYYITEDMVKVMKKGSVIVDISIDQGGCVETSECRNQHDPVFTRHGVVHYCVPNIPSSVARTASIAVSNVLLPILIEMGEAGGLNKKLKDDKGLRHGVYVYNGILTNEFIGKLFDLPSKDIDLFMAAF